MHNQDDINPSDSISNVGSKGSSRRSSASRRSTTSSTSSARIKAEADVAALLVRQNLMKEKHSIEENEQNIRKQKEEFGLRMEIAATMAKVKVLKGSSVHSVKSDVRHHSDGINSYVDKGQQTTQSLNADAKSFISTHQMVSSGANANKRNISQIIYPQTIPNSSQRGNVNVSAQYGSSYSAGSGNTDQIFHIMDKQNEITSLLVQQQCPSSLPKREIQVFDGNPLQYHSFMKSFESGVESKTESPSDRLYFLEQYTRGHPREIIKSCQHMPADHGYLTLSPPAFF